MKWLNFYFSPISMKLLYAVHQQNHILVVYGIENLKYIENSVVDDLALIQ